MAAFDLQIPFFLPVWRRALLIAVCFVWCIFEFVLGAPFWGLIFGSLGGYAFWQLFLREWPEAADEQSEDTE
jgi:hypothetical protein